MRQPEWSLAQGSSTMVWRSYNTPTFIGLTCLSASSTNCVWWCADARTALLHSIWRYIGHQSLRPHHDSIFVRLPAINWQCRHIGGPHMAVGHLLSLVRRCGTHCQNVYVIPLLVLPVFWKQSSSQSTSVSSALKALAMMRYINLRFTLHYITDRTKRTTDRQHRANRFTNCRPKTHLVPSLFCRADGSSLKTRIPEWWSELCFTCELQHCLAAN